MSDELPRMDDHTPHGDPLKPRRDQAPGAEPRSTEAASRLDELEDQDVGTDQAGEGPQSPPPRHEGDVPEPQTAGLKLGGEDEGPSTVEGGGQGLAGGQGGTR